MTRLPRLLSFGALLAAAACGPFDPDPTLPGGGNGGGGTTNPTYAVPFRLGSTNTEEGRGVAFVGDGVVMTSWFAGRLDFDQGSGVSAKTSFGAQDIGIAKYGLDGTFRWVTQLGGTGADVPNAVAATPDGGVVVVGYGSGGGTCGGRTLAGPGGRDILVAKIGPTGTCEWGMLVGGTADDEARGVAVDADGSVVVAGLFRGTADFDPTGGAALLVSRFGTDAFLARYSATGEFIAVTQAGGTEDDLYSAVTIDPSGEITVTGEFRGTATFGSSLSPLLLQSLGGADICVARYSELLGLRWAIRAGGPLEDRGTAVALDGNGDVLVAGSFEGIADLDPSTGTALVQSQGAADVFLARYDHFTGDYDGFSRSFGGIGSEGVTALVRHISGRTILSGYFQETVDFDPGTGARLVTAKGTGGAGDLFVSAFSSTGDLAWVVPIGGVVGGTDHQSIANGLALDDAGTVWATGRFFGRADFDPGEGAVELTSLGDSADGWLSRYGVDLGTLVTSELQE